MRTKEIITIIIMVETLWEVLAIKQRIMQEIKQIIKVATSKTIWATHGLRGCHYGCVGKFGQNSHIPYNLQHGQGMTNYHKVKHTILVPGMNHVQNNLFFLGLSVQQYTHR